EPLIPVPQTQSAFHPHAQRNAFRRHNVRSQFAASTSRNSMIWKNKLKEKLPLPRRFGMNKALFKLAKPHLRVLLTIAASVALLNFTKADVLTAEEQALVDKGAVIEMYKPNEHTRNFIAHIDSVT